MGERRTARAKRKVATPPPHTTPQPRWARRLSDQPPVFYLLAAIVVAVLIGAFVITLEESSLALAASIAFAGLLVLWTRKIRSEWSDGEPMEKVINVVGALLLVGAAGANVVRYLLLR